MESEVQGKEIEWAVIVEYFTKRGRPLSKDEIHRLVEEDRKQRDEEESKKRGEEEAERRRVARLMEDLEGEQDFETYEMQQQQLQNQERDQDEDDPQMGARKDNRRLEFDGVDDDEEDDEEDIERGSGGYVSDPELGTAKRTVGFASP
jgi:hypothetical protein